MPSRKTETSKKISSRKSAVVASKKTPVKVSTKENKKMTLGDLQSKVMDKKNRKALIIGVIVVVLLVALYLSRSFFVAATVNGEPISRISIVKQLEAQSGRQVLDREITKKLVLQQAAKKNISASTKEINDEIAKIDKQVKDQGQNLDQLLAAQGLTRNQFADEVKIQILVQKVLGNQAKVTDKEFEDFLAKNQSLIENEPDKEAAKKRVRQQLEQQKLAQKYQDWIANIKKDAKIMYLVNY